MIDGNKSRRALLLGSAAALALWRPALAEWASFQVNGAGAGPPPPALPTLSSVSPSSGLPAGGTAVTLTGTNFTGATGVTFGGLAATSLVVVSSTSITCTTPAHLAGAVSVIVTTAAGSNAANSAYSYVSALPTLSSVSPSSGLPAGGTAVTLTGTNFTGATGVTFGGLAATSLVVVSSTSITCTTPAHLAGAVSVIVTTAAGSNAANSAYSYISGGQVATIPLGTWYPTNIALNNATRVNNADGTSGVTATQYSAVTGFVTFPADDVYLFTVQAFPTLAATLLRANMIQVLVDQAQIPADGAPANTPWSLFAATPINGPATDYVFRAPVFAGSHPVGVALCTAQNNALNPSDNSQAQGVHAERLIITALGTGIAAEPAGSRDPYLQPGSSLGFHRCAIGSGAVWGNGNQTISSGNYNTTTGVITITLSASSPFVANQRWGVALTGLTGTGANLANLNGNWPCLTSAGSTITLQGPANRGTITITGGTALDADVNVIRGSNADFNFSIGSFSIPFYQGQSGDSAGSWLLTSTQGDTNLNYGNDLIAIAHLPTGMAPAGGSDGALVIADATNKRYHYSGSNPGSVSGLNVTVGIGAICDSYNLNHASNQSGKATTQGIVRFDDVVTVGAINHTLHIGFVYYMVNGNVSSGSTDVGWPAVGADYVAAVHPVVNNAISSGTYNSTTGAIVLTMVQNLNYAGGGTFWNPSGQLRLTSLAGSGTNLSLLNSVFSVSTLSGSTVTLTGPTGLGTISITGGLVSNLIGWCDWGSLVGIPASTPKPAGLNAGASMLWDCAQHYGFLMDNQAGNAYSQGVKGYADISLGGNTTMNQINAAFPTILDACSVLRNNTPANFTAGTPTPAKGGGTPLVAQQAGLVARSTYPVLSFAPPPPSVSTPFRIASAVFNQASGAHSTTTVDAPLGSLIVVLLKASAAITSITDSAGNIYQQAVASAITAPNIYGAAIWFSRNTTHDLPVGGTITVNGPSNWDSIVYAAASAVGGLDRTASAISTTNVTSLNLSLGTISQANELCFGLLVGPAGGVSYVNSAERWNSTGASQPELFGGQFNLASYLITSAVQTVSYTPFWGSGFAAPYAAAACSFRIP